VRPRLPIVSASPLIYHTRTPSVSLCGPHLVASSSLLAFSVKFGHVSRALENGPPPKAMHEDGGGCLVHTASYRGDLITQRNTLLFETARAIAAPGLVSGVFCPVRLAYLPCAVGRDAARYCTSGPTVDTYAVEPSY